MFDVGGAGRALIFMSALTGLAIAGPLWLAYVSHALLVVITESSLGDPEVRWPDESVMDWWWKPLYCGGMLSFWVTGGVAIFGWLVLLSPWAFGIVAGLFLWYAYPLGMLCAMDAQNSLAVVHLPLVVRVLRHPLPVLLVGLSTLPLGVAMVGLLFLMLRHSLVWVVPFALVLPVTELLYARSWGRLAWLVLNIKRRRRRADERQPPEAAQTTVHDPWALPPREEIPEVDVEMDEPPDPGDDNEWSANPRPYGVPATREEGDEAPPFSHEQYYADYRKREAARQARAEGRTVGEQRRRRRATLGNLFGPDFWQFLGDHRTLRVGLGIGLLTLVTFTVARCALAMLPG